MTNKYTLVRLITVLSIISTPAFTYAADSVTDNAALVSQLNCVVTAYYQPLEGQQNYQKGNLSADIALNGDDTTADGSKVKLGTVAAPPEYPFGTIIDIDGFGVGEVHDRGGAIKGNRFDIWVGKGDEGLGRALNWGKRTTNCTVYLPGSIVPSDVKSRIGTYNLPAATLPSGYWEKKLSGGHKNLSLGDVGDDVLLVRKQLQALGFAVEATGNFDSKLEKQVIKFQVQQKVIATEESYGAGVVGPRTWQALLTQANGDVEGNSKSEDKDKNGSGEEMLTENPSSLNEETKTGSGQIVSVALAYGAEGAEVSKLQQNLRSLGYFDAPTITGYFGPSTKAAIIRFQLKEKLIKDANVEGAGDFDEKTRAQMLAVLLGKKTAAPVPSIMLARGSKGPDVKILQEKLQKLGIYNGPITDFYGEQTETAIKEFQKQYNVQLNTTEKVGVFEKSTATRLDQALGMDISLSPTFSRYIEQFTLVEGKITMGN